MKKTIVFGVGVGEYSDAHLLAVFVSREQAEKYIAEKKKTCSYCGNPTDEHGECFVCGFYTHWGPIYIEELDFFTKDSNNT